MLRRLSLSPFGTNTYLYAKETDAVVIDPAGDAATIENAVRDGGYTLRAILLTHAHFDHIDAIDGLCARFDVPVYVHEADAGALTDPQYNASAPLLGTPLSVRATPTPITGEPTLTFGEISLRVLHAPGHTRGCVCYYDEEDALLFSGDVLFYGSIGRTDLFGSDDRQMRASLDRLATLPPSVRVYPGHGPDTTIGDELEHNPYL